MSVAKRTEADFDTSGGVGMVDLEPKMTWGDRDDRLRWSDLSPFTQGYVEALFAAHSISRYRSDIDQTFSHGAFDMLAPETLARIIADCEAYLSEGRFSYPDVTAGRAFWSARQLGGMPVTHPPLTVILNDAGKVVFQ